MRIIRKIVKYGFILALFASLLALYANWAVENKATGKVYEDVQLIPENEVGLLLGTGKFVANGRINLYYQYRIDATVALYKSGKIKYILISGDNSRKSYDEPSTMKEDLIAMGVPEEAIFLDYAGFRTLDSVVRAKMVFGQSSVTIISQPFHNKRAIYLGESNGLNVVGYNAKAVSKRYGFKVQIREKLARVKMLLDVWFGKEPKFLGEEIKIG